jgi:hypothetical protein
VKLMNRFAMMCLSVALLMGCQKKQNEVPNGAKAQKTAPSTVQPSPVITPVASTETASPAKTSEQQPPAQSSPPPQYPTLAQVLATAGLKPPAEAVKDFDHGIASYATLNDSDTYLIAYYWSLPSGRLEDPLRVLSFNRKTEEWKSAQLMLGSDQIGHSECGGSVLGVHASASAFLLDTHINPSAGCLVILDRNLAFRNALYGWYLAVLDDTQIVFERSQVHFAAVHPAELALYDLTTHHETPLFPRKPFQRVRSEYTRKLREFYRTHQEWCQENNDPCDAESVDSTLHGEVAVKGIQHALAFVISYDRIQDFAGPVQKPEGPGEVVYIYRDVNDEAKLDYREMPLRDVERRFGKVSLRSLLEPAALREIFGGTVSN